MSFKIREAHWQLLLEAMEKNPVLATGKFLGPTGRENYRKMWEETARKLNALGFGSKTTEKWQKSWADYKYNLKKKAASAKKSMEKTGGGPPDEQNLSELDLKLLDILGESFIGLNEPECGLPPVKHVEPQPSTSTIHSSSTMQDTVYIDLQSSHSDRSTPECSSPSSPVSEVIYQTGQKRKLSTEIPVRKKESVTYLSEYRETIKELREIKEAVQTSLNGIANVLTNLVDEVRQLNNSVVCIADRILEQRY